MGGAGGRLDDAFRVIWAAHVRGHSSSNKRHASDVADALRAGYRAGSVGVDQVVAVSRRLAADPARPVAPAPVGLLRELRAPLAAPPPQLSCLSESAESTSPRVASERPRFWVKCCGTSKRSNPRGIVRPLVSEVRPMPRVMRSRAGGKCL